MSEAVVVESAFGKVLDLDQVKALAYEENYLTIFFNEKSRVISFIKNVIKMMIESGLMFIRLLGRSARV